VTLFLFKRPSARPSYILFHTLKRSSVHSLDPMLVSCDAGRAGGRDSPWTSRPVTLGSSWQWSIDTRDLFSFEVLLFELSYLHFSVAAVVVDIRNALRYGRLSAHCRAIGQVPPSHILQRSPTMSLSSLLLDSSNSTHATIDQGLDDLFKSSATVCNHS
jgi:hypothetical protein